MRINKNPPAPPVQPLIRLRSMLIGVGLLLLVISGPLLIVTKQVYITNASLRMDALSDSLKIMNKEIATLKLTCERLSSNERIEQFARESRGLEYPNSNQIVIVKLGEQKKSSASDNLVNLVAVMRRAFGVKG